MGILGAALGVVYKLHVVKLPCFSCLGLSGEVVGLRLAVWSLCPPDDPKTSLQTKAKQGSN